MLKNTKKPTIYFDLDGTLCSLYTVQDWDKKLINQDHSPFIDAKPMFHLSGFCKRLINLQKKGYKIGIVTWLSMDQDDIFNDRIRIAKAKWIKKHFTTVKFDYIFYMPYGTDKDIVAKPGDILFDDDMRARKMWDKGPAYSEKEINKVLYQLQ